MKQFLQSLRCGIVLITVGCALAGRAEAGASGGRFRIDHESVTPGGGSQSANERFRLNGVITRAGAGTTGASRFQLLAGELAAVTVVQTPDAPRLEITVLPGGFVRLSWQTPEPGFILQGCSNLSLGNWQAVLSRVTSSEAGQSVTVPAQGDLRVFRLFRP